MTEPNGASHTDAGEHQLDPNGTQAYPSAEAAEQATPVDRAPFTDQPFDGQADTGIDGAGPGGAVPDDAAPDPDDGGPPAKKTPWFELPVLIIIALVLAVVIKTFFVQAFYIPSASMENTLQGGNPDNLPGATKGHPYDRILVNKLVYDFRSPRRGEIVVFKGPPNWRDDDVQTTTPSNIVSRFIHDIGSAVGLAPAGSTDFVKRVIGVAGDTVSCRHDVLSVNGHPLTETFLYPGSHACSSDGFEGHSVTVKKGQLFVMGDHRDDSSDSRVNGDVPVSDVLGRAFVVIWPVSDWRTLPIPSTFKQSGIGTTAASAAPGLAGAAGAAVTLPLVARRRRRRSRRAARKSPLGPR
jgi:signal peptidase I